MARSWVALRLRLEGMDSWLRALSAVAGGAVLAVAGWWGWAAWEEARPGEVAADPSSLEVVPAGLAAWQDECLAVLAAQDRGEGTVPGDDTARSAALAAERVGRCRDIVAMRPHEWPTN